MEPTSTAGAALSVIEFIINHWTDIMVTLAAIGHFFQQKTIVAKLGQIAAANEAAPPAAIAGAMAAAEAKLNK